MLILPADLPLLERASLDRLLDAADAALAAGSGRPLVAIAPSDARDGTNGLLLFPTDVIEPAFGAGSFEAHVRAAAAADATLQVVTDAGLGFDLDTPEDLEMLPHGPAGRACSTWARRPLVAHAPRRRHRRLMARDGRILAVCLPAIPEVRPGDDLGGSSWPRGGSWSPASPSSRRRQSDVLVVTQKVVSKAEGRIVDLRTVEPRPEAVAFGERWDRDPRQVEVVLRESVERPAHGAGRHHLAHPARLRVRQRRRGRLQRGRPRTR